MIEGYDKLGAAATVMSDKTVERLEAAQDKWDAFWNSIVIHSGEALGAIAGTFSYSERVAAAIEEVSKRSGKAYDDVAASVHSMSRAQQEAFVAESEGFLKSKAQIEGWMNSGAKATTVTTELTEEQKKAAAAAEKHAEALQSMADVYTGKALTVKISDMNAALAIAEKQGGLTAAQVKALGKELDGLKQQGATLTPKLQDVWREYQIGEFRARDFSATTVVLTKNLSDQTRVTIAAVPSLASYNAAFSKMIATAQAGGGPASIGALQKLGTAIKELPAPPASMWQIFANEATNALGYISQGLDGLKQYGRQFAMDFVSTTLDILVPGLGQLVQAAWPLIEKGLKKIWGGIKAFWHGVTSWFSGLFGGGGDKHEPPDSRPSDPHDPGGMDPGNPDNPTAGDGGMNAPPPPGGTDGRNDNSNSGRPGYALGTGGRYVDFGARTTVDLHGRERVVTEAEGRAEAGGIQAAVAAMRAMVDEHARTMRQIVTENRLQMMAVLR